MIAGSEVQIIPKTGSQTQNSMKLGKSMGVAEKSDRNGREGCVGFGEEENVVFENECHFV